VEPGEGAFDDPAFAHSGFALGLALAPSGGEVKRVNQPRMGDESTPFAHRCVEHRRSRGSMRRSLLRPRDKSS
jgi:hypothetical protein